jgi:hypothetical protein
MREKNIGFILGFIAGEGSFTVNLEEQSGKLYAYPRFKVAVHERDRALLDAMAECVGLGAVYGHGEDSAEWRIDNQEESQRFAQQVLAAADGSLFTESDKYEQFVRWLDFASEYDQHPTTPEESREVIREAKEITHADHGHTVEEWVEKLEFDQQS